MGAGLARPVHRDVGTRPRGPRRQGGRAPQPDLTRMSREDLAATAAADPVMAELPEMAYLFDGGTILDAAESERVLGLTATGLDAVARELAAVPDSEQ
ncbi:hypothetical protein ACU686_09595 [Yinghuangia aomiensis]